MTNESVELARIEDSLRQGFEATVEDRAKRYQQVKPHGIIPGHHFAAVSAEIGRLYSDGHYYGCISLCQSVAEALARFLCERNGWKAAKVFEKNLVTLQKREKITAKMGKQLLTIWKARDDYHHLNPTIERDRTKLQVMAEKKAKVLSEVESSVFGFCIKNGVLIPDQPKYWDLTAGTGNVFLRLEP